MKLVRVFEHKGESYQLYEFRGVYLHPGVGRHKKTIVKRKGLQYIKNENYFMCKWIGLKLGLPNKEVERILKGNEKDDVIW